MKDLKELKEAWDEAKKEVIEYFDKKEIKVFEKDGFAYAYDKKTKNLIYSCDLEDEDIVVQLSRIRPEVKSEELDALEKKLDKSYSAYIKQYLAEEYGADML